MCIIRRRGIGRMTYMTLRVLVVIAAFAAVSCFSSWEGREGADSLVMEACKGGRGRGRMVRIAPKLGCGFIARHPLLVLLQLRGGGRQDKSDEDIGDKLEEEDEARSAGQVAGQGGGLEKQPRSGRIIDGFRKKRKIDSPTLMYKPGGLMGMGSLRMVEPSSDDENDMSDINCTDVPITVQMGDSESEEPPPVFRSDWWNQPGVTREDIMKYLRTRDEVHVPDINTNVELNEELTWAASQGDVERVIRLIDAGAEVNAGGAGGSSQWTALHHAARSNMTETAKALVGHGARVQCATWGKWTALHWACEHDNVPMTEMLLDAGAELYWVNSDGHTAYDVAEEVRSTNCQSLLTARGYSRERATNLKSSVRFIAPQLPRDRDGVLGFMVEMTGDADGFSDRINMQNEKTAKVSHHGKGGSITLKTYIEGPLETGEAEWKREVHCNYDPKDYDDEPESESSGPPTMEMSYWPDDDAHS